MILVRKLETINILKVSKVSYICGVDTREQIIETSGEIFLKYGIRSVTMLDIANNLGISKKTIYSHFKDKDEIVYYAVLSKLDLHKQDIFNLKYQSSNVIEELVHFSRYLKDFVCAINPSVLNDMQKYYPDTWQLYCNYKKNIFTNHIIETLHQGIQEGYFRPDINPEIIGILRMEEFDMMFNDNVYPRESYSMDEVQEQLWHHFVLGITTPEGCNLFKKYLENQANYEY